MAARGCWFTMLALGKRRRRRRGMSLRVTAAASGDIGVIADARTEFPGSSDEPKFHQGDGEARAL